jgi:hypothetical protein
MPRFLASKRAPIRIIKMAIMIRLLKSPLLFECIYAPFGLVSVHPIYGEKENVFKKTKNCSMDAQKLLFLLT